MIKVALEIKEENKAKMIERLKTRKYNVDENSFNTVWVYDLGNVRLSSDKQSIFLENGTFYSFEVKLDEINYFEIHSQGVR